jgi:hypothetical protein
MVEGLDEARSDEGSRHDFRGEETSHLVWRNVKSIRDVHHDLAVPPIELRLLERDVATHATHNAARRDGIYPPWTSD